MNNILIIENYRQTLTVIRSLARTGYHIILGKEGHQKVFTEYSRFVKQTWVHPKIQNNEKEFIDSLADYLSKYQNIDYIFPVGEISITCLARNIHRIDRSKIIMPNADTVFACLDKSRLMAIVSELKIPMEEYVFVNNLSELQRIVHQFGFPLVIKPNDSLKDFYNKKIITCHSQDEFQKLFTIWPNGHSILIVQKLAIGKRHNCYFTASHGKICAYFENIILRTDRLDGSGYYVEGVSIMPTPCLMDHCRQILERLNYHGVGCIQFLYDQNEKKIHFLELNPRFGANGAFPYFCGIDFPRYALDCVQGNQVPSKIINYSYNRRMHWLMGDIKGLIFEIKNKQLTFSLLIQWIWSMVLALIRSNYHITWDKKDPGPTFFIYFEFLRRMFKTKI